MKQLLIMLVAIAGVAAHADYLYWMVDGTPNGAEVSTDGKTITEDPTTFYWTEAKLYADGSAVEGATLNVTAWNDYQTLGGYAYANVGSDYAGKSFTIELFNGDQWLARSNPELGSSLAQYITGGMSMNPVAAGGWAPTSYAVPEPTSGLLFLVGGVLLGLKRRREVV